MKLPVEKQVQPKLFTPATLSEDPNKKGFVNMDELLAEMSLNNSCNPQPLKIKSISVPKFRG